jgi:hypothetical protein
MMRIWRLCHGLLRFVRGFWNIAHRERCWWSIGQKETDGISHAVTNTVAQHRTITPPRQAWRVYQAFVFKTIKRRQWIRTNEDPTPKGIVNDAPGPETSRRRWFRQGGAHTAWDSSWEFARNWLGGEISDPCHGF